VTLHAVVAGWLLGPPSGANHRLLALLGELGPALAPGERITVLIGAHFAPPPLPGITWRQVDVAPGPTWRRVLAERQLASVCDELGATVLDHGFLPPAGRGGWLAACCGTAAPAPPPWWCQAGGRPGGCTS
jgi:hypothetical protein